MSKEVRIKDLDKVDRLGGQKKSTNESHPLSAGSRRGGVWLFWGSRIK